jgi:hypothetical protein
MQIDVHMAVVTANDTDPEKEFGIEVRIDSVEFEGTFPVLVYPFFQPNFFKVPDIGQTVLVVLPADLPLEGFEGEEVAMNEFADQAFYMLRGFDSSKEGKPFADFVQENYPKRSGYWLENGTMILFDETQNDEAVWIRLTDGKQGIVVNNKGVTLFSTKKVRLGNGIANEALHKGNQANADLLTFLNAWIGLLTTLSTSSLDAGVIAYANAMKLAATGPIEILKAALPGWLSQKTFVDV